MFLFIYLFIPVFVCWIIIRMWEKYFCDAVLFVYILITSLTSVCVDNQNILVVCLNNQVKPEVTILTMIF